MVNYYWYTYMHMLWHIHAPQMLPVHGFVGKISAHTF